MVHPGIARAGLKGPHRNFKYPVVTGSPTSGELAWSRSLSLERQGNARGFAVVQNAGSHLKITVRPWIGADGTSAHHGHIGID